MKHTKLTVLALTLIFNTASAHLPYVLPFQFNTDKDIATLYAGSADRYFEPEIPGVGYDITVTNPLGESDQAEYISRHKQLTLIEIDTKDNGTYKVDRVLVSRVFPQVLRGGKAVDVYYEVSPEERRELEAQRVKEGEVKFVFEDEVKPNEIEEVRYVNHVTAYVTKNKPNNAALKITKKGFEFDFKTHPNAISVKSGLKFTALVDGKPAPEIDFKVLQKDHEPIQTVKSDSKGLVSINFKQAGTYVLNGWITLDVINGKITNPRYINWLVIEVLP
jgi:hypothetical protein